MLGGFRSLVIKDSFQHSAALQKKKRSRSKSVVRARRRREKYSSKKQEPYVPYPVNDFTDFEKHVMEQCLVEPGSDHSALYSTLRRPLPIAFCIRDSKLANEWKSQLQKQLVPSHFTCIPIKLAHDTYQVCGRERRDELNSFVELRRFLNTNTDNGSLVRQETVSMIPCVLLQIQHQHAILDLCASPGSKTTQAVDAIYSDFQKNHKQSSELPKGFVVANDADASRCYVLSKRCSTSLKERSVSLIVTCHNARRFPNVQAPLNRCPKQGVFMTPGPYDRIICDVPCSGDGTIRKDFKVFKVWHPGYGISLHPLQLQIAMRGVSLLKVGGLMTYSTCSFNPIENEAVVYELLKRYQGSLELVDPEPILKESKLVWREGWDTWSVVNDDFLRYESFMDSQKDNLKFYPSMWPSSDSDAHEQFRAKLKYCVRMCPQDNDTGGFFIALLKKTSELKKPAWMRLSLQKNQPPKLLQLKIVTAFDQSHLRVPKDAKSEMILLCIRALHHLNAVLAFLSPSQIMRLIPREVTSST